MNKSLAYFETLLKDEDRCLSKLLTISKAERNYLIKKQLEEVFSLRRSKQSLIFKFKQLDQERRDIQINIEASDKNDVNHGAMFHKAICNSLLAKLKKSAMKLLQISQENILLIQNRNIHESTRAAYGNQHREINGIWNVIFSNQYEHSTEIN